MTTMRKKQIAYAAHFDGDECSQCGEECRWSEDIERLVCGCSVRTALSVWLGNTP